MIKKDKRKITNYQAGASVERRIKEKLEDKGYFVVRSAGSHGLADLVVISPHIVELIQVKSYDDDKPDYTKLKEFEAFKKLQVPKNVRKFIILYKRHKGIEEVIEVVSNGKGKNTSCLQR